MKLRHIFIAAVAVITAFTGCKQKEEDLGPAGISTDVTELTFTADGGSQLVEFIATRDWNTYTDVDWIVFTPAKGDASTKKQSVEVSALPNTDYNRSATFTISIGLADQIVTVTQVGAKGEPVKGDGTKENPYTASQARDIALNGTPSSDYVYIKGYITKIATAETAITQYGNHNFYICDTPEADANDFYCFQVYDLGKVKFTAFDKIKVGDEVIVCGKIVNYNGTPETQGKGDAYLYSLNGTTAGETPGGTTVDYNTVQALTVQQFIDKADENNYYKLTGTVSGFNATYCSFDLTDDSGKIYVYSVDNKADWSSVISNGGTVTLAGKYLYYATKSQHEVVNAQILSFTAGGSGTGTGETGEKMTLAQLIASADNTIGTVEDVYVAAVTSKGYVASDGTNHVYVYGAAAPSVAVGDKVNFSGTKTTYYSLPEITSPTTTKLTSGNTVPYPAAKDITTTFDSYASTSAEYITFTAKVVKDGTYTNFQVEGATARVGTLSHGTSAMYSTFAEGDSVKVAGFFNSFNTSKTPNLLNVIAVSVTKLGQSSGGGNNDNPPTGDAAEYTSNVTWVLGENAYDKNSTSAQSATVNGVAVSNLLKLGKSSAAGTATITIPKGTTKVTFYGVSWTGKPATLSIKVGDTEIMSQPLAVNSGATGNAPYTMTVTASDKYTKTFDSALAADTQVTVTTSGSNYRVILFGIKAE